MGSDFINEYNEKVKVVALWAVILSMNTMVFGTLRSRM